MIYNFQFLSRSIYHERSECLSTFTIQPITDSFPWFFKFFLNVLNLSRSVYHERSECLSMFTIQPIIESFPCLFKFFLNVLNCIFFCWICNFFVDFSDTILGQYDKNLIKTIMNWAFHAIVLLDTLYDCSFYHMSHHRSFG